MRTLRPSWSHDANLTFLLVLLGVLLFVILPLLSGGVARVSIEVALSAVLVSACYTVTRPRALLYVTVALTVASLVLRWVAHLWPSPTLARWNLGLSVVVLSLISLMVSIWVLGPGRVSGHRIRGAMLVYLLLGLDWSLAYTWVEVVTPGSFAVSDSLHDDVVHHGLLREMVYYSFVTLTTVGYGDVTPLSQAARQLAILEALVGQLFPVIVIGRMVSLEISAAQDGDD